jgi:hypothetical protein
LPDNVIKTWNTSTWEESAAVSDGTERVYYHDLLFSPDGRYLQIECTFQILAGIKFPEENFVFTKIIEGAEVGKIADAMERFGEKTKKANFDRDAASVRGSEAILLIGIRDASPISLNCGACGYDNCTQLEKKEGGSLEDSQIICMSPLLMISKTGTF